MNKRHICNFCKRKRYETFLRKALPFETNNCSQFGNDKKSWICLNKKNCDNSLFRKKFLKNRTLISELQGL